MRTRMNRVLVCGLCLAIPGLAATQAKITGIVPSSSGENSVLISGTELSTPKVVHATAKNSYKLVFDGGISFKSGSKRVRENGLRSVSYGWQSAKPPRVWVQLNFDKPTAPRFDPSGNGWSVSWGHTANSIAGAVAKSHPFPDRVPPIEFVRAIRPAEPMFVNNSADNDQSKVTLDFVGTDVVQILKALALQANVNIVTSPEVQGKITVSLHNVSVTQALDFVTTMGGLRYTKMGLTFVVTASDRFALAIQQLSGKMDSPSETRVITLQSGEGTQIKTAVLKAIPTDTLMGRYEMVLPSERVQITSTEKESSAGASGPAPASGGQPGAAPAGSSAGAQSSSASTAIQTQTPGGNFPAKDPYLVLIGAKTRLDEVESLVMELDGKIIKAARLGVAANISTRVVAVYSSQIARIRDALKNMIDRDPNAAAFQVSDSVASAVGNDSATTLLMLSGPAEALDTLENFAKSLDRAICEATSVNYPNSPADAAKSYEVVELKWVEPIEAAFELQQRIRGLEASIMPGPADPLLSGGTYSRKKDAEKWDSRAPKGTRGFGQGGKLESSSQSGAQSNNSASGQGSGTAGGQASAAGGTERESMQGASAETRRELGGEPMQLLLRGTKAQIMEAHSLLNVMDIAPKVLAVDMRVMTLTKDDAIRWGIDWETISSGLFKSIRFNQGVGDTSSTPGTFGGTASHKNSSTDFLASLDKADAAAHLIARPNMLAVNGKASTVFVGEKIQYVKTIQATQNGTTIEVGELEVGVEMTVVPRIGADGNIVMELAPSLTILRGFTPVPGGGSLPQTIERYAQTQVVMKSGETIALGGLIQDEDRKSVGGVPILKDIPLIGKLFSREDKRKIRTEVVFFLTVREVSGAERTNAADPRAKRPDNPPQK